MANTIGVPDLLTNSRLTRAQSDVKQALSRAQTELSTGEIADKVKATGGDPAQLLSIDRTIATIDARSPLLSLAQMRAATTQTALGNMQNAAEGLGTELLSSAEIGDISSAKIFGRDARLALEQMVSLLNSSVAGRSLFAGALVDGPAVAGAAVLQADVQSIIASAPDIATLNANLDLYFNTPFNPGPPASVFPEGGFDNNFLLADGDAAPAELAEGDRIDYAVTIRRNVALVPPATAEPSPLKDMLRGLVVAAVAEDAGKTPGSVAADTTGLGDVYKAAGIAIFQSVGDVNSLRAVLGLAEQRIDNAMTRDAAERTTLASARNDLVRRDEFEVANEITTLQTRLQAIFAITARASELSLLNFLR